MIFDKEAKDKSFNKWCWNNWTSTCKKINLDTDLTLSTKKNSKWITDLTVKCKTIKLLESKIGENLEFGDDFLDKDTKGTIHERRKW